MNQLISTCSTYILLLLFTKFNNPFILFCSSLLSDVRNNNKKLKNLYSFVELSCQISVKNFLQLMFIIVCNLLMFPFATFIFRIRTTQSPKERKHKFSIFHNKEFTYESSVYKSSSSWRIWAVIIISCQRNNIENFL